MATEAPAFAELNRDGDDAALWDSLIEYIAAGAVIPVVGRDLLTIPDTDGVERQLYAVLARELARTLRTPVDFAAEEPNPLGAVASQYLLNGGSQPQLYRSLHRILGQHEPLPIPDALSTLATI